jgi:transcriptional regulator with XRE-family HTH domain
MLGDELRNARDAAKMTQEALSYVAEVDCTYISQLENNKQSPTVDILFRICKALGVSASDVIARSDTGMAPPTSLSDIVAKNETNEVSQQRKRRRTQ